MYEISKSSLDRLTSKLRWQTKISGFEDLSMKLFNLNNRGKNIEGKKNRASRNCGEIWKSLTYIRNWSPKRKGAREWRRKIFEEIMFENFSSLVKNIILQIRSSMNPSRINSHTITSRHIKLLKTKGKEKILKAFREKE